MYYHKYESILVPRALERSVADQYGEDELWLGKQQKDLEVQ